jgi:hypothetical protein
VGAVSIVLAIRALAFGWIVYREHNKLNIEFTKNLSTIQLLSSETNRLVNSSIDKLVDEFFKIQRKISEPVEPTGESTSSTQTDGQLDYPTSLARLERLVNNLQQTVDEAVLRQRLLQTGGLITALDDSSENAARLGISRRRVRFPQGTRVKIVNHPDKNLVGKIGTVAEPPNFLSYGSNALRKIILDDGGEGSVDSSVLERV